MASNSSTDESSMEEMKKMIQAELEQLREECRGAVSVSGNPKLHDDDVMDSFKKTKLLVESELEATMQEKLLELPDDKDLLLQLAREEAETMEANNARTLEAYKRKVLHLQEEKKFYDSMIQKATEVDEQLENLIATQTKEDTIEIFNKRFQNTGKIFKALRSELQFILSDLYPDTQEEGGKLSVENFLELLITKVLNDPQDPYVTVDEDTPDEYVAFCLRVNLIRRHPQEPMKIRFTDPRQ